jgi:hypothetical protein
VEHKISERRRAKAAALAFEMAPSPEWESVIHYFEAPGCLYTTGPYCGDPSRASVFNYERRYCRLALRRPKGRAYQLSMFKYCAEVKRVAHFDKLDPEEVRLTLLGRHFLKLGRRFKDDTI